ncbi:MAG: hypothetical protein ACK56I_35750, partial [bacterium]
CRQHQHGTVPHAPQLPQIHQHICSYSIDRNSVRARGLRNGIRPRFHDTSARRIHRIRSRLKWRQGPTRRLQRGGENGIKRPRNRSFLLQQVLLLTCRHVLQRLSPRRHRFS